MTVNLSSFQSELVCAGRVNCRSAVSISQHALGPCNGKAARASCDQTNKRCQPPPTLSALALSLSLTHTHTHCLLSRLKFICCIQMPASNYTSTCSERVSEQGRGGREGGKGEVTMGHLDTVAIARPTLCLDPS